MKCEWCNYEGVDFYQFMLDKLVCPECKKINKITEQQIKEYNKKVDELHNEKR